jgi:hypothetical protein
VVFATATILAALRWRQDCYLFIIGAVAFTAATIGYRHRRRRRRGDADHIAGMGAAYVVMLTAFYAIRASPAAVAPAAGTFALAASVSHRHAHHRPRDPARTADHTRLRSPHGHMSQPRPAVT